MWVHIRRASQVSGSATANRMPLCYRAKQRRPLVCLCTCCRVVVTRVLLLDGSTPGCIPNWCLVQAALRQSHTPACLLCCLLCSSPNPPLLLLPLTVPCKLALRHKMAHMTATGAVRVACRGLSGSHGGLRRSMEDQSLPQRGYSRSISKRTSNGACSAGSSMGSGSFGRAAGAAAKEAEAEAAVAAVDGDGHLG